jgi:hypothetical protein
MDMSRREGCRHISSDLTSETLAKLSEWANLSLFSDQAPRTPDGFSEWIGDHVWARLGPGSERS